MVRLALLIVGLLGMFLLNACSGNARDTTNIDTKDAVFLQTGKFTGTLERVAVAEYDEAKQAVVKKEQPPVFTAEDSIIEVDWDSKKVKIETKIVNELNQDKKSEPIILEGQFNDEGIAFLFPINAKGKELRALGALRCKDNMCKNLTIDLGADIKRDGKASFEQEQMDIKNPSPLKVEVPESTGSGAEEIYEPESSGARNTGDATQGKEAELAEKKKEEVRILEAKKKAALEAVAAKNREQEEEEEEEEEDIHEMFEPGTPAIKTPSLLTPAVERSEIRDRPDRAGIKFNDYSESKLFPYNLGEKYSGKAIGQYDNGQLLKGTDIIGGNINGDFNLAKAFGFSSIRRTDKVHYGSGFLVKMIEEAAKLHVKSFPKSFFEIDDTSKMAGGKITRSYKTKKGKWVAKKVHASHQNGLDADILLPKKGNKIDYQKAWSIVKSFASLGYVDVIFLNKNNINAMCRYLKSSNEKGYEKYFNRLYPESGHTSHLHMRLKCTNHNINCVSMAYTESKRAVCR